ncbi:hypothetical protein K470DRAFT_270615 [Piedraia hortae CBS 480.64]|uniref:RING-type domain-containing protein n=1 Tax=Piedraia hortae CBS 480.64 TaxID=1314780 RepID=A0A6A7C020_9PEZI|nr:hypothetical protein K470DRAFT_270615 [Piedraia hortae CBS 480.64]
MSGYHDEHNIPVETPPDSNRRRPDLTTFFSTLTRVDTSGSHAPQNPHSLPFPEDISAVFRNLAEAFVLMNQNEPENNLLQPLIDSLLASAADPPAKVDGVSDEFLAQLERVPKKSLTQDMVCPICSTAFLDDPHPLVVRLPCHKDHIFDLECIQPWLKLNPTCPVDRKKMIKEQAAPVEDDDEEYDEMFA